VKWFQQVSFFHFHTWLQYFHHIPSPSPFPNNLPFPLVPTHQTGPALPSCSLCLKKRHFCLLKLSIQGISLLHFCVYVYYNTNWFIPSIFLFLP
jgi:hypothetical protein